MYEPNPCSKNIGSTCVGRAPALQAGLCFVMLPTTTKTRNLTAVVEDAPAPHAVIVSIMQMVIRRAALFDVPAIMFIVRAALPLMHASGNHQWDDNYPSTEIFLRDIQRKELWVADFDGVLGGVAAITTEQTPEYANVGWDLNEPALVIHRLVVDPEFRGHGIAVALMQEAEALAEEQAIHVLRVDTSHLNEAAQRMFLKLGYNYSGEITIAYRPGLIVRCYEKRI